MFIFFGDCYTPGSGSPGDFFPERAARWAMVSYEWSFPATSDRYGQIIAKINTTKINTTKYLSIEPVCFFLYHLVGGLEHEFYDFPFSWECHHPNWRTYIFQRGRSTTNQIIVGPFSENSPSVLPKKMEIDVAKRCQEDLGVPRGGWLLHGHHCFAPLGVWDGPSHFEIFVNRNNRRMVWMVDFYGMMMSIWVLKSSWSKRWMVDLYITWYDDELCFFISVHWTMEGYVASCRRTCCYPLVIWGSKLEFQQI